MFHPAQSGCVFVGLNSARKNDMHHFTAATSNQLATPTKALLFSKGLQVTIDVAALRFQSPLDWSAFSVVSSEKFGVVFGIDLSCDMEIYTALKLFRQTASDWDFFSGHACHHGVFKGDSMLRRTSVLLN